MNTINTINTITLKKASQILAQAQRRLTELQQQLKPQGRLLLVRTDQDPVQLMQQRMTAFEQQEQQVAQLTQVYYELRDLLGQANQQLGIPSLLTRQALINAEIRRITPLAQQEPAPSAAEFQALWLSRLEHLNSSAARGYLSEHVEFSLISAEFQQQLQQRLTQLRRELLQLTDQLTLLNVQNTLQVPAQCWTSLEQLGVV